MIWRNYRQNYRYQKWWEIYRKIIDIEKNDLSPTPTPNAIISTIRQPGASRWDGTEEDLNCQDLGREKQVNFHVIVVEPGEFSCHRRQNRWIDTIFGHWLVIALIGNCLNLWQSLNQVIRILLERNIKVCCHQSMDYKRELFKQPRKSFLHGICVNSCLI